MDVAPFHLVPFQETTIPKPAALATLTADNVPSLQELRNLEQQLRTYKSSQEQRVKHCDEQLKVVNEQYAAMKERDGRDGNKVKQLKKGTLKKFLILLYTCSDLFCCLFPSWITGNEGPLLMTTRAISYSRTPGWLRPDSTRCKASSTSSSRFWNHRYDFLRAALRSNRHSDHQSYRPRRFSETRTDLLETK